MLFKVGFFNMKHYGTPEELLPPMQELLSCNKGFWLTVTGGSMNPTLRHLQDQVYISPFKGKARKGDILLTAVAGDRCFLHRVFRCSGDNLYYKGDAQSSWEGPFPASAVIGIVTKVKRRGCVMQVNNLYRLYSLLGLWVWRLRTFFKRALRRLVRLCGRSKA